MRLVIKIFIVFFFLFVSAPRVFAATPQVTDLQVNANSVGRYQKFEATFHINKSFTSTDKNSTSYQFLPYYYYDPSDTPATGNHTWRNSPYGENGITIDAHIRPPNCTQTSCEKTLPAFYYQKYTRSGDVVTPVSPADYSWKIRFAPSETGQYTYYITVQDKEGTTTYQNASLTFQSVASSSKGYIRVSTRDPRFFEYGNGESFVPVGSARQYYHEERTRMYDQVFDDFGAHGINFVRVWDQNDGYALTVEGHYDAYDYPDDYRPTDRGVDIDALPKGTQMNQRGNFEEDLIIAAAERNNVKIQLCAHGDVYWLWDASTYNPARDDPWNKNQVPFMNQYHLNYVKRNFRYRIARWGYSTAIMSWEYWNEQDRPTYPSDDLYQFYQTMSSYVRATDPYKHLITTSNGSQTWRPNIWGSPAFDYANYHDYLRLHYAEYYNDEVRWAYNFAQCLRANDPCSPLGDTEYATWLGNKPIIWGEADLHDANDDPGPNKIFDHNMIWTGLFSPIGMTPIDWYFKEKTWNQEKFDWDKIASNFFSTIDYAGEKFSYLSTADVRMTSESLTASDQMRVLAMRSNNKSKAFAWVQHKGYTWGSGNQSAISGTITIPGMAAGDYRIEYWQTHNINTANPQSTGTATASGGNVTINISGLTNDVAIKIISTSVTPATPTPGGKLGDVNADGKVNAQDLQLVLSVWLGSGSCANYNCNINGDYKVNALDAAIVLINFGK